ncbi:MAG: hypothetical protein V3T05_03115, partial [Myxococcota bacterium]
LLANQPQRAERELRRAMRDDVKTPDGELYLGLLLLARGDRPGALEIAVTALGKDASSEPLAALRRMASDSEAEGEGASVARLRAVLDSVRAAQVRGAGRGTVIP